MNRTTRRCAQALYQLDAISPEATAAIRAELRRLREECARHRKRARTADPSNPQTPAIERRQRR
jgi:hypothetical protein